MQAVARILEGWPERRHTDALIVAHMSNIASIHSLEDVHVREQNVRSDATLPEPGTLGGGGVHASHHPSRSEQDIFYGLQQLGGCGAAEVAWSPDLHAILHDRSEVGVDEAEFMADWQTPAREENTSPAYKHLLSIDDRCSPWQCACITYEGSGGALASETAGSASMLCC